MAFIDITGQRFGRWMVVRRTERLKKVQFICRCDCGTEKAVNSADLRNGSSTGCRKHSPLPASLKRLHPNEHNSWCGMKQRCNYEGHIEYHRYGGRGIKHCQRWSTFKNFLADMGVRPDGCSLDRIDNDKDYSPENCRWASKEQQSANTSHTIRGLQYQGKEYSLKQLADELGVTYPRLHAYVRRRGLSLEAAIEAVKKPGINRPYRYLPSSGKAGVPQHHA